MKDNINPLHLLLFLVLMVGSALSLDGCKVKTPEDEEKIAVVAKMITVKVTHESGVIDTLKVDITGKPGLDDLGRLVDYHGGFSYDIIARQVVSYSILKEEEKP